MHKPRVLLTGGAGYIGSHSCVAFSEAGCEVALLDNLCNSSPVVLDRLDGSTVENDDCTT